MEIEGVAPGFQQISVYVYTVQWLCGSYGPRGDRKKGLILSMLPRVESWSRSEVK